jgi:hypothetical protein
MLILHNEKGGIMWGVEFRKANNGLICGSCEFECRAINKQGRQVSTIYRVSFGPHDGITIQKRANDGWELVRARAEAKDLEAILPNLSDFMHQWTYRDFMIAMTFFGEGYNRGYNEATWKERNQT